MPLSAPFSFYRSDFDGLKTYFTGYFLFVRPLLPYFKYIIAFQNVIELVLY